EQRRYRMDQAQATQAQREFTNELALQRQATSQQRADTQQQSAQDRARHMTVREQQFQQGLNQNKYVTKVGKDGNLYAINKGDPSDVIGITKADGTPFESWDSAVEAGRKARFEEAQNRQDRRQRERIAAGGGKKGRGMTAQQAHVAARDELIKE